MPIVTGIAALSVALVTVFGGLVLLASGRVTLDVGVGRRVRPLGPQIVRIQAPRDLVFDLIAVPYLAANPPRALRDKVEVLERSPDMVLAAHRTPVGGRTAVTVETVSFDRPTRVGFRLVRGPVPHVVERFDLLETDGGDATLLEYVGEMGTDGWALGAWWGRIVAARWEQTVARSLQELTASAQERHTRARARAARAGSGGRAERPWSTTADQRI